MLHQYWINDSAGNKDCAYGWPRGKEPGSMAVHDTGLFDNAVTDVIAVAALIFH